MPSYRQIIWLLKKVNFVQHSFKRVDQTDPFNKQRWKRLSSLHWIWLGIAGLSWTISCSRAIWNLTCAHKLCPKCILKGRYLYSFKILWAMLLLTRTCLMNTRIQTFTPAIANIFTEFLSSLTGARCCHAFN